MMRGTRLGVLMAALALFGAGCATVDWTEDLFAKQRVEVDTRFGKVEKDVRDAKSLMGPHASAETAVDGLLPLGVEATTTVTSRASFDAALPDGLATYGHVLLVAVDPDDGQRVGVLWFGPSTDDPAMAWVYDITVDEERRRQGWGRAIMRAFEGEARAHGFVRAGLNVYGDNHVARRLYESLGYVETSRQLHKELPGA